MNIPAPALLLLALALALLAVTLIGLGAVIGMVARDEGKYSERER